LRIAATLKRGDFSQIVDLIGKSGRL